MRQPFHGPRSRPHRVAVLVFDDVSVFEMAVPCEVWGIDRTSQGVPPSEVRVCTADPLPLATSMGFTIDTANGLETVEWADTIVLPAAPKPYTSRPTPPEVVDALRAAHRRGARLASVCTGAYVIADTGLLDGRRATTHWMWAAELAARHPEIDVDPSVLYVADAEAGLFTSAGTGASTNCACPPSRWGGTTMRRATVLATSAPWSRRTMCRHMSMPAAVPADVNSPASASAT